MRPNSQTFNRALEVETHVHGGQIHIIVPLALEVKTPSVHGQVHSILPEGSHGDQIHNNPPLPVVLIFPEGNHRDQVYSIYPTCSTGGGNFCPKPPLSRSPLDPALALLDPKNVQEKCLY